MTEPTIFIFVLLQVFMSRKKCPQRYGHVNGKQKNDGIKFTAVVNQLAEAGKTVSSVDEKIP